MSLRSGFIHVHRKNLTYWILSRIFIVAARDLHRHDGWVAGIVFVFVLCQVEWIILRLKSDKVTQRFEFALCLVAHTTDFCMDQVRSNCWTGCSSKIFIHHLWGQACREIFHLFFSPSPIFPLAHSKLCFSSKSIVVLPVLATVWTLYACSWAVT